MSFDGMADDPNNEERDLTPRDEQTLTFLRRLVTVLTTTMILGVLTIVVLLVMRLNSTPQRVAIPAQIALPQDTVAIAVTQTAGNILIVTDQNTLLVFNASGSELLSAVQFDSIVSTDQE